MLAVDNASVRLARAHVHTGFTERLPTRVTVRWTRYGYAAGPARRAVGVRRNPCRLTSSACGPGRSSPHGALPCSAHFSSSAPSALFSAARVLASTAALSVRYTGATERLPTRSRSAKPVWACGWSSQTRRRRPEESVQTDQRGLRGQCDLRDSATWCAASPASRSCGPRNALDSTARVARSARRAGHLVQQAGCTPRPRRRGLHEGLDQHGVDQRTGRCRCPTTTARLPHTGFAERLRRPRDAARRGDARRRGDGATGRRGDGATGRRGDGATGQRGDGATGRR